MLDQNAGILSSPMVGAGIPESDKLTVILLNHKRPANIGMLARYLLKNGFVSRLVISNNSQAYTIQRYVDVDDARLVLLNQDTPAGVGIRFELAQRYDASYYLLIDDDIFLHPAQLQWLYWSLRHAPDRPHGIWGAALSNEKDKDKEWPFVHQRNRVGQVDILNGLFTFTRVQLQEYGRLCGLLGITDQKELSNGEDIILSFSGTRKPMIHNVGRIWECTSASEPGVALYASRPRFYEERWRMFAELRKIKSLND
jgi:hypothetical protein